MCLLHVLIRGFIQENDFIQLPPNFVFPNLSLWKRSLRSLNSKCASAVSYKWKLLPEIKACLPGSKFRWFRSPRVRNKCASDHQGQRKFGFITASVTLLTCKCKAIHDCWQRKFFQSMQAVKVARKPAILDKILGTKSNLCSSHFQICTTPFYPQCKVGWNLEAVKPWIVERALHQE